MIENSIVVAPATAVAISTGFAVALNVLPAPSLSSRKCLPFSKSGLKPNVFSMSAATPGVDSTCDSSKMDWALSVTGPYESTAIVTGPMPSRPNATRPNANTDGYCMNSLSPCCEKWLATSSSTASVSAFQNTEKLPATMPDRMLSDAPPSLLADTTSATWRECELVNTFVNSGITAAASVPHEMITDSANHIVPPSGASSHLETVNVTRMDRIEHTHTRLVSGASKLILSLPMFCARENAALPT